MNRFVIAVVFGIVLTITGPASAQRQKAVASDSATLVGTWRVVSLEADGKPSRPEDVAKITVINTADGGWTILVGGKMVAKGTNELLCESAPKGMDIVVTETSDGPTMRRHQGIYELEQDTRRLCFSGPGAARPVEFAAPQGSGQILVSLERVAH